MGKGRTRQISLFCTAAEVTTSYVCSTKAAASGKEIRRGGGAASGSKRAESSPTSHPVRGPKGIAKFSPDKHVKHSLQQHHITTTGAEGAKESPVIHST